jgi:hypothetical protein
MLPNPPALEQAPPEASSTAAVMSLADDVTIRMDAPVGFAPHRSNPGAPRGRLRGHHRSVRFSQRVGDRTDHLDDPIMRLLSCLALLVVLACQTADDRRADRLSATDTLVSRDSVAADSMSRGSSSRWVVTPAGFGPVLAGMPAAELRRVFGEAVTPSYSPGSLCAYVRPAALPPEVLVMIERDTVARVDVRAKGVRTAEGVGVGDTEQRVLDRYAGRVRTSPHKYTGPTGHYLIVSAPPDTTHLIVFETDGRMVTNYRSGRRPAVELVEGCS